MSPSSHGSLGVLLAAPPSHPSTFLALATARQAIVNRSSVHLYCLGAGVLCVERDDLQSLRQQGAHLVACAYAAQKHGVPISHRAVFGGLLLLANIIAHADRFLAFTPTTPAHASPRATSASAHRTTGRRRVLVHTHCSPLNSVLAAEGCRLAAGLTVRPDLDVTLLLNSAMEDGPSSPNLDEPDPDLIGQHLRLLMDSGGHLLFPTGSTASSLALLIPPGCAGAIPERLERAAHEAFAVLDF